MGPSSECALPHLEVLFMKLHAEQPLCRAKSKMDVEELGPKGLRWIVSPDLLLYPNPYKFEFASGLGEFVCGFCQSSRSTANSIILMYYIACLHMQDWANVEASNQKNMASAIIFLARRNERARPIPYIDLVWVNK